MIEKGNCPYCGGWLVKIKESNTVHQVTCACPIEIWMVFPTEPVSIGIPQPPSSVSLDQYSLLEDHDTIPSPPVPPSQMGSIDIVSTPTATSAAHTLHSTWASTLWNDDDE